MAIPTHRIALGVGRHEHEVRGPLAVGVGGVGLRAVQQEELLPLPALNELARSALATLYVYMLMNVKYISEYVRKLYTGGGSTASNAQVMGTTYHEISLLAKQYAIARCIISAQTRMEHGAFVGWFVYECFEIMDLSKSFFTV